MATQYGATTDDYSGIFSIRIHGTHLQMTTGIFSIILIIHGTHLQMTTGIFSIIIHVPRDYWYTSN